MLSPELHDYEAVKCDVAVGWFEVLWIWIVSLVADISNVPPKITN